MVSTPNLSQKAAILDAKAGKLKKIVKRKKHPQVINILKKSVSVTTITKHIVNLGVNLTIDKLLTSTLILEK